MAASVPSRAEFLDVVRNLAAECQRYGVEITTGAEATADSLRAESPDAVAPATGARPQPPYWAWAVILAWWTSATCSKAAPNRPGGS